MITEPTTEAAAPKPSVSYHRWLQTPVAVGAAYFAYNVAIPNVPIEKLRLPQSVLSILVIASTLVFMFLLLWVPRAIIAREWNTAKCIQGALLFGVLWAVTTFAWHAKHTYHVRPSIRGLMLAVSLAFFGALLSRIVREAKMLLPIALVAMVIDVLGAMMPRGFTRDIYEQHPGVIPSFSVPMPGIGSLEPISYVGPGDALFIAFFFGIVQRYRLNMSGTFWMMFGLLSAAMLAVNAGVGNIAALLPMGIAVIVANFRYFKFDRSEMFAMIYAGILAVVLAAGFFAFSHKQFFGKKPSPARAQGTLPLQQTAPSAKKN
ncbi:hypothetical protein CCAX7_47770 [Capsulimonas corticalis]|uniref:Uncharacterized protein n=1 Tax=Capsulimonas corticalis TaxID=2219043 RepID=A0A402CQJ7_9BACT|nr:hypothetical protein [Capsulimonas corticalis]BDI32726.1 hypothetical protein CCAX7_47770 [Capsulimonas corticalis]